MKNQDLLWEKDHEQLLYSCSIFDLHRARHSRHDGKSADFYLLHSPDWVNVIPITTNSAGLPCFVLVRQYRPGAGTLSLEFPGGLVDQGESPDKAAIRELAEETGYSAGELVPIGATNPNPAFMTNTMTTYIARDLTICGQQDLDEHEHIQIELVPIQDILDHKVPEFLVNGIMLIALGWYVSWTHPMNNAPIPEQGQWDFTCTMEVRDYELDSQGIVNNSTYLNYFEHARHKFLQSRGVDFRFLQSHGIDPVVVRVEIDYLLSLESTDQFQVHLRWEPKGRVRSLFYQEITRMKDNKTMAKGKFVVATLVNKKPGFARELFEVLGK